MSTSIFRQASYDEIKRQCLRSKVLFEDPLFPANDASCYFSRQPPRPFVWKRPSEIVADPKFVVGGASRFDVTQGKLDDAWLLAALAGLSLNEGLLNRVITGDQTFVQSEGYCGVFRFTFWVYGEWKEIVIDDRLPTYNDSLVFVHSKEKNEFWSALLEKAYAKLHGSYEALKAGSVIEGMEDFTGGVCESIDLTKGPPEDLFTILSKALQRSSLMGCSINAKPNEIESKGPNGLVKGHPYTITHVVKVNARTRSGELEVELIRIRNPWGTREWEGAWSDSSNEWGLLSDDEKRAVGLTFDDDGEFWMSISDFKSNFERIDMCHLGADSFVEKTGSKSWESTIHKGAWRRGFSAGGCRNFPDTFHTNPQFSLVLEKDEEQADAEKDDNVSFVVALTQMNRRAQKKLGQQNLTIGFAIYKADETYDGSPLPKDFFLYHASSARSPTFINTREVTGRYKLSPGQYCIVPSTFDPNQTGEFILRIYSEKPASSRPSDEPSSRVEVPERPRTTEEDAALNAKFKEFFDNLAGADEEIDAWELQKLLSTALKAEMEGVEISIETCRSVLALVDDDRSGKLGFEEFKELWLELRVWRQVFSTYDADKSGQLTTYELRGALRKQGFKLGNNALDAIALRYANQTGKMNLDNFIAIIVKLKFLFNFYLSEVSKMSGRFTLDDFLQSMLYS